ncbi:MAG: UDP-4-amino-4,6-dideoxy-N-acetyl-beta-L-altrosamine transaminase [Bacteroidetes bacterium GWF2_38_335]|nr:MAG: UDP-4-amino-4,6-dideoxy-N-acetyl-beta-L-altrosamine transaminase [Bacteroidetes bacterium GWF2_38_335]OFY77106.1 MAG: UDP-4-amino-4,6-dideoxy-N-acetyl-beta-L-altrosamine transaminase [Bacteroidetes bacterium RIFOXYA12_FULL_38_20]HBS84996.1 UDP-4-amino-4,6-dideoxy-N-acetyl-beta-L-altrosamine transaminase [Bacteroidales bacterium]
MNPIPYGRQNITQEDIEAVVDVLKSDYLTQGPKIAEFEKAFAEYIGCKYAVAVSNGTAALHLCTLALGVGNGHKVITTPITFAASANCIRYAGGEVVFADIDPKTYLLDISKVEEVLKSSPKGTIKGIIPVDFAGRAVNLEAFRKLADQYGCWIIEDACHAPGGYFIDSKGQKQNCGNGNYAELAIFSFHPVKHIACGEGGMITTNDEKLYQKLLLLRTHGITKDPKLLQENHGGWYYEMQELGFNYRLTDFQAALGISQLKRADDGLKRRREIAMVYEKAFTEIPDIKGQSGFVEGHGYHLYIIETEKRKGLYDFLREYNIFSQVHYIPVHLMPYYKQYGWKKGDMPIAEKYYERCLSLPMYPTLKEDEQEFTIKCVIDFCKK